MMGSERWSIGVDPGFGETGLVLCREADDLELETVEWSTFKCPSGSPDLIRAVSMAGSIVNRMTEWVEEHDIQQLDIAIELPVYKRNAQTIIKQVRLLEEIESGIFFVVSSLLEGCWLTEVNPITSKSLAGCRRSEKPVAMSPFANTPGLTVDSREALADAWAHSLSTWGVGGKRIDLQNLKAATVRGVAAGPDQTPRAYWEGVSRHITESEAENAE